MNNNVIVNLGKLVLLQWWETSD